MSSTAPTYPRSQPPAPPRPVVGPSRFPLPLPSWERLAVTAQVPHGAGRSLAGLRVGDTVTLGLALLTRDIAPCYVGADRWRTDEHGFVDARGTVALPAPNAPLCVPAVLEVAGRSWPLTGPAGRLGSRVEVVDGAVYVASASIDPAVAEVAFHDARRWSIRALRRYVPGRGGLVGASLRELPEEPDDGMIYVADLGPE